MKRTGIALVAAAALTVGGAVGGTALATQPATAPMSTVAAVPMADISSQGADDLRFAREEERMARDLYRLLADHYDGARPFANIVNAEQRHYDVIGTLLTRYGIADPSAGKSPGIYADPAIQNLFDDWKARGLTGWPEALQVGIALEKHDVADLEKLSSGNGLPSDVKTAYANLLGGSRNHLAAFTRASQRGTSPDGQVPGRQGQRGQGRQGQGQQGQGMGRQCHSQQEQSQQCQSQQGQSQGKRQDQRRGQGHNGQGRPGDCTRSTPETGRAS